MELKIYTKSHDINDLRKNTQNDAPFTAAEKSKLSSKEIVPEFKDLYKTVLARKEDLGVIVKFIKDNRIKKIISIGSHYPIQEYYISKETGAEILCFDFDKSVIRNSKLIFKNEISIRFYDMNTAISEIISSKHNIDCVIFLQSLYIFNKDKYARYLENINELEVKYIIDKASVTSPMVILKSTISNKIKIYLQRVLNPFFPSIDRLYLGKFHGYTRTENSLEKIYNGANLIITKRYKNYFFLKKQSNKD